MPKFITFFIINAYSGNDIDSTGAQYLANALQYNSSLLDLNCLWFNLFILGLECDDTIQETINALSKRNKALQNNQNDNISKKYSQEHKNLNKLSPFAKEPLKKTMKQKHISVKSVSSSLDVEPPAKKKKINSQ